MEDRVSRIQATRLCLGDGLPIESPEGVRWARVTGLALDGEPGSGYWCIPRHVRPDSIAAQCARCSASSPSRVGVRGGVAPMGSAASALGDACEHRARWGRWGGWR